MTRKLSVLCLVVLVMVFCMAAGTVSAMSVYDDPGNSAGSDPHHPYSMEQQRALYLGVLAANASYAPADGYGSNHVSIKLGEEVKMMSGDGAHELPTGEIVLSALNGNDRDELTKHGFQLHYYYNELRDVGVLLAERGNIGIIALRGTASQDSWSYNDLSSMFRVPIFMDEMRGNQGYVGLGFNDYVDYALAIGGNGSSVVKEFAHNYGTGDKQLIITGHSLGGCAALLAMKLLNDHTINLDNMYLTTFGQPKLVNQTMMNYAQDRLGLKHYDYDHRTKDRYIRAVRYYDYITDIPPVYFLIKPFNVDPCYHFGEEWHINWDPEQKHFGDLDMAHNGDNYVQSVTTSDVTAEFRKQWQAELNDGLAGGSIGNQSVQSSGSGGFSVF